MSSPLKDFKTLCCVFEKISETKKRLEIQEILSNHFKELRNECPELLIPTCYLCLGIFQPEFINEELGIGETHIIKIISESTNRTIKSIKQEQKLTGDLGLIAAKYKATQLSFFQKKSIKIDDLHQELIKICREKGFKSQSLKINRILKLLSNTDNLESKYLIRIIEGKLKIGLALKTVLISLGIAFKDEDSIEIIKEAYSSKPVFELILPILIEKGIKGLRETIGVEPGIPVKPMLAHASKGFDNAISRLGTDFLCEYKYDGERAQIHKLGANNIKVFSRNSEDLTEKYPELNEILKDISDKNFILDSEIVAYDELENKILPFQILATRKRKNVDVKDIKVTICVFVFDVLYFGNQSLIEESLEFRRACLVKNFKEMKSKFQIVCHKKIKSDEELNLFFQDAIKNNCEGLMLKNLTEKSEYTPSKRCFSWLKLKKDYIDGMGDSLDLVVLGCYYGKGKRTGSFGGFLMGCYDDENDIFECICKLGTGFDDQSLTKYFEILKTKEAKPINIKFNESIVPDIWVEPSLVWEIKAAGFSLSPIYTAGSSSLGEKGISLRFPRFIRERSDKNPHNCTNSSQIISLYHSLEVKESSEEY